MSLPSIERAIGYVFSSRSIQDQALTHRSFGAVHNERLEFLGEKIAGHFRLPTRVPQALVFVALGRHKAVQKSL